MSAIANLVLNDGAATPVAHTFSPVNIDALGIAKWADRVDGIAIGYPTVSLLMRQPNKVTRNYKLSLKVICPTLEVTSPSTGTGIQPAPTKAYDTFATVEIVLPERSTKQQRKDMLAFLKNSLANAVITAAVEDFESVY